ncbi:hypothetical protein ACSBR1_016379 [Camellia fascicularis]
MKKIKNKKKEEEDEEETGIPNPPIFREVRTNPAVLECVVLSVRSIPSCYDLTLPNNKFGYLNIRGVCSSVAVGEPSIRHSSVGLKKN